MRYFLLLAASFSSCAWSLSSRSSVCHAAYHSGTLLAKTKETFRLADLQYLEAKLQLETHAPFFLSGSPTTTTTSFHCHRLVIDAATGSSLLEISFTNQTDSTSKSVGNSHGDPAHKVRSHNSSLISTWPPPLPPLSCLERCEWIADVLVQAESAPELIRQVSRMPFTKRNGDEKNDHHTVVGSELGPWTLKYLLMGSSSTPQDRVPRNFTQSTLLCAVAQAISLPAALDPEQATDQLMILHVSSGSDTENENQHTATNRFYLVRQLPKSTRRDASSNSNKPSIVQRWAHRPFPYSSAIHPTVAEIVIDLLKHLAVSRILLDRRLLGGSISSSSDDDDVDKRWEKLSSSTSSSSLTLLDPTCGSGTFLAVALDRGFRTVVGCDSNPTCIEGTKANLLDNLGCQEASETKLERDERTNATVPTTWWFEHQSKGILLSTRDSSMSLQSTLRGTSSCNNKKLMIDCVACNLPWGINTGSQKDSLNEENWQIIQSVRKILREDRVPCAFVSKAGLFEQASPLFESYGFRTLGTAHIPQKNFVIPGGSKQRRKLIFADESGSQQNANGRSDCVVTIVETIPFKRCDY